MDSKNEEFQTVYAPFQQWNQVFSFTSRVVSVKAHYHYSYQIVISLTNPFDCQIADQTLVNQRGFILNQGVLHSYQTPHSALLISIIEANSDWGWQLKAMLKGQPYLDIVSLLPPQQLETVLPKGYEEMSNPELIPFVNRILETLFSVSYPGAVPPMDHRIIQALTYIDKNLHTHLSLEEVAEVLCLSPDRARHFFSQQTGVPFTQYIVWKRIKIILASVLRGELNLAKACIKFGFVDQSHFNQRFKRIFGVSPSVFFKEYRLLN